MSQQETPRRQRIIKGMLVGSSNFTKAILAKWLLMEVTYVPGMINRTISVRSMGINPITL